MEARSPNETLLRFLIIGHNRSCLHLPCDSDGLEHKLVAKSSG